LSLPLYMDHHVPSAITRGLRRRGLDVLTAAEDGAATSEDETLLARATELGRILFSQDDDLLAVAARRLEEGREFAGLVYGHQLAVTIGKAVRDLEIVARVLDPAEIRNRIEFLPL
jgi:hypothetical protein